MSRKRVQHFSGTVIAVRKLLLTCNAIKSNVTECFSLVDGVNTHLTHSHINATVILANIEVEIFVVNPQVATFRKFAFEPKTEAMSISVV